MLHDSRALYRLLTGVVLVFALIALVLRALALCLYFDRAVGYFNTNIFSTLLYIGFAAILLCLIGYTGFLYACTDVSCPLSDITATTERLSIRLGRYAVALVFLGSCIYELTAFSSTPNGREQYLALARILLAALSALCFVLRPRTEHLSLLSCPILFCVVVLGSEYFDWTISLNSPLKLFQQFTLLAAAMFLLTEMQSLYGKRPLLFPAIPSLCAILGISNGGSLLIAALVADGIVRTDVLVHSLPTLILGIYAGIRLLTPAFSPLPLTVAIDITQEESDHHG